MTMKVITLVLLALAGLAIGAPARAADPCPQLRTQLNAADVGTRIAAIACQENHAWFRPFIDADGHGGTTAVYEAETSPLADGGEAWRRVANYWKGSDLGSDCDQQPACRNFVIDTPWSAAFVSWVMRRAGLPGFRSSASHVDYVRAAWRQPIQGPYELDSPHTARPAPGDLLCYARASKWMVGADGLSGQLQRGGLPMHCDIVVAATPGELAYLVGGNVQQAVTLRMLRLDQAGRFADLPQRNASDP
ncbi:MAG: DUF2272 domain-containing protein, partial [Oxalobacteraceae bacterium]